MMAGNWSVVVNILFPIPFTFLLILCLPLPAIVAVPVRRVANYILKKIIFPPVLGGMNVYQIVTLFSAFLFTESLWQTMTANDKLLHAAGGHGEQQARCMKWRHERNFWIALFSLVSWLILYRVHRITEELDELRARLKIAEGKSAQIEKTAATSPEKPHSH